MKASIAAVVLAAASLGAAAVSTATEAPPNGGLVVNTAWLAEHLKDPDLVLLHVGEKGEYDAEHLPGARFVQLRDIAAESQGEHALEMPAPEDLRKRLERLGISDDSRIVVYFGKDWVSPTTRVILTLDYFGLGARTSLLDGGMGAWKREGRALTAEVPPARTGTLTARAPRPLIVDHAWIQRHIAAPGTRIVDARAPVFYDGPSHGEHRAGHVPGAVNIPFTVVAGEKLYLESTEKLGQIFRAAGVQPGDTVAAYCHVGQQATAVIFAARLLGHPVRLYDGSFEDWSRRKELPVEGGRK